MSEESLHKAERLAALPDEWPEDLRPAIQELLIARPHKLVVLDDDPTGTQTVHDIPVLTEWSLEALADELANDLPAFYVLTNTRSMPLEQAQAINTSVGQNLRVAAQRLGRAFAVVSRSDSTLRGHFPGEVAALASALADQANVPIREGGALWARRNAKSHEPSQSLSVSSLGLADQEASSFWGGFDAWLLVPFFLEGGRLTIDDVHYVASGDQLVPAGATEFARDRSFGYRESNLRAWVAEKTAGRVPAEEVASISLDDIRRGGPQQVAERLSELRGGRVCVVNAASMRDLEVVVAALLEAEAHGKRFLYRTAASFVQVRAGIAPRPLLAREELALPQASGGLVMVGSYVPTTSRQVAALIDQGSIKALEVDVTALIDDARCDVEVARIARLADEGLRRGEDVLVVTSRELVAGPGAAESLEIGRRVSDGLCAILRRIESRPRYLVAKGGITSSDLATHGLGVRRALVLGQALPGVPVWRLGAESRYPGLVYVVFPGNVGGPAALAEVVAALSSRVE
jgi:uncharacterized protein YgbK (DUF1537 family)